MAYSLVPEWVSQSAIMLTWPSPDGPWQQWLDDVEITFTAIAKAICQQQSLIICCQDQNHQQHIRQCLINADVDMQQAHSYCVPADDGWARDCGPISVRDAQGEFVLLDFQFNGWGNKYPAHRDNQITQILFSQNAFGNHSLQTIDLVLEGGSIDVDGNGSLMTTTDCLLNPHRNPQLSQNKLEKTLREYFGVQQILWLTNVSLLGDDTDGHIDTLARFCNSSTICYLQCTDHTDPRYPGLSSIEAQLQQFRNFQQQPYQLIPLPMPRPIYDEHENCLPATYANFLIINGAVLVPTYADENDAIALERLATCFPNREIIGIDCRSLIRQYGSLHCVTMQLPAN